MIESQETETGQRVSLRQFAKGKLRQLTDGELVSRALPGNEAAFEALMERYTPIVVGYLAGKAGSRSDTEDIAQEVFLTAFRSLGNLRNPERFGPWLQRITRTRLLDHYRAKSTRLKGVAGDGTHDPLSSVPDGAPGPDGRLHAEQTRQAVVECIAGMREKYRVVLSLRLFGEYSCEEIGEHLKIKPATVRMRLHRGMKKLRQLLKKRGIVSPEEHHNNPGPAS